MSAALCLITWNVAIGRSNCTRSLAYSTARSLAALHRADQLGAHARRRSRRRCGARSRVWSPVGPDRSASRSSSARRPSLRNGSHAGTSSACGRFDEERRRARTGCGPAPGTSRPSAPSGTAGFSPCRYHRPLRRRGAGPSAGDRVAVAELVEGDGAAGRAGGQRCELVVEAEPRGRDRGEHGRRRERPGERHPAHLLEHRQRRRRGPHRRRRAPRARAARSSPARRARPTAPR